VLAFLVNLTKNTPKQCINVVRLKNKWPLEIEKLNKSLKFSQELMTDPKPKNSTHENSKNNIGGLNLEVKLLVASLQAPVQYVKCEVLP
jgi:hypothetical protein